MSEIELRPEVAAFAEAMELELRENDHKGGWSNDDPRALVARLREEVDELDLAVNTRFSRTDSADARQIITSEAADVANFAMMIADVCGRPPKVTK